MVEGETIQETLHLKVELGFPLKLALILVLEDGIYSCVGPRYIAERTVLDPFVLKG